MACVVDGSRQVYRAKEEEVSGKVTHRSVVANAKLPNSSAALPWYNYMILPCNRRSPLQTQAKKVGWVYSIKSGLHLEYLLKKKKKRKKEEIYSETYMNLDEPVYQNSMGSFREVLGQISTGKSVLHLCSLQGKPENYGYTKCLSQWNWYNFFSFCTPYSIKWYPANIYLQESDNLITFEITLNL